MHDSDESSTSVAPFHIIYARETQKTERGGHQGRREAPLVRDEGYRVTEGFVREGVPDRGVQGGGAPRPRPAQRKILSTWGG